MSSGRGPGCASIGPLVTPYVDGELAPADRGLVQEHLGVCAPCRSLVTAERATRELLVAHRPSLTTPAPAALHARCAGLAREYLAALPTPAAAQTGRPFAAWRARLAPLAAAAALVIIVGGAFLYVATGRSTRLMAAELAADHVKCFTMNAVFGTRQSSEKVQHTLASSFNWTAAVPRAEGELDLVGSRPCVYGQGRMAHIMYRHDGAPVSLFMLPRTERAPQMVEALGYSCAIWSKNHRTFVLVSRGVPADVQKLAAAVQASMP
jgi:anti-sigma factor RsiW